ncbi:MAG: TnsA endonuclease N-terminal domain-containing protein [Gammaproteobacteria bacterium]
MSGTEHEGDPLPDRLREALTHLIRACVPEQRRCDIALQVLGLASEDGHPSTMAAIARAIDRSRERVRQLRNSAFRKIAANAARRAEGDSQLRDVLRDISAEVDWRDPVTAARSIVSLMTDHFEAAGMLTYLLCRAAGSKLPTKVLRHQSSAAAEVACNEATQRTPWPFDRWATALEKAIFQTTTCFDSFPPELTGAKRTPRKTTRDWDFNSKRLGRIVLCESSTEARVYRWLERSPDVRWYQEQPIELTYEIEGCTRPYFPDAAVMGNDGRVVMVEVKPFYRMYRYKTLVKALAALNHCRQRGIGYLLVDDSGRTLDNVAACTFSTDLAARIELHLQHGPVRFGTIWREFNAVLGRIDWPACLASIISAGRQL